VQANVFVVVVLVLLLVLLAHAALTARVARIRSRVGRLERENGELSRTVATVQGWAEEQLRAVRGEFTLAVASAASAPLGDDDLEDKRDTIAMPATALPASKPGDEEGEATTFFGPNPPLYAMRSELMRPPAPLAHPDLIGSEDAAEDAAYPHLGPDEKTPPRHGRAVMFVAACLASEEVGAEWRR
jgi:hypothetical protein